SPSRTSSASLRPLRCALLLSHPGGAPSPARVEAPVRVFELRAFDVGVDLGRLDVHMTEDLLNDPQVGAAADEVGRHRMAEGVGGDATGHAGELRVSAKESTDGLSSERTPAPAEEEEIRSRGVAHERGPLDLLVLRDGLEGGLADGDDAFA